MGALTCADVEALPVDREPIGRLIDCQSIPLSLESSRPTHHLFSRGISPDIGGGQKYKTKGTKEH